MSVAILCPSPYLFAGPCQKEDPGIQPQMMSTGSCLCCSWLASFGEEHVHPYSGGVSHSSSGCPILPKHLIVISVAVRDAGG